MITGKVNWGIVPFRVKMDAVSPDPSSFEPIAHSFLRTMLTGEGAGHRNLVDYFLDVSHGRLDVSGSIVLPWMDLPSDQYTLGYQYIINDLGLVDSFIAKGMSEANAAAAAAIEINTTTRARLKQLAHTAIKDAGLDVSPFFGLLFIIAIGNTSGLLDGSFVIIADNNPRNDRLLGLDLSAVACEMAHAFGFEESVQQEDIERTDPYDLMSVYGAGVGLGLLHNFPTLRPAYFAEGNVHPPASPPLPFLRHGPGLSAANMHLMGWLDNSRLVTPGAAETVVLRPLHRRDLPGALAAQIGSFFIEFRTNEKWDLGIPKACILLHEVGWQPVSGNPRSELVIAHNKTTPKQVELFEGDVFEIGNPVDIFRPHLRITVEEINPSEHRAKINVVNHSGRQARSGLIFGAVDVGGSGFVWTPGSGFKRIPPESPLRQVSELAQALQLLVQGPGHESAQQIHQRQQISSELLKTLNREVARAAQTLGQSVVVGDLEEGGEE